MTSRAIASKAAVAAVQGAIGTLPQAGRAAVLEHLLSDMTPKALQALSPKARAKLVAALPGAKAPSVKSLAKAPARTKQFRQLVKLTNGTLEARLGTCSDYEFRLTLKGVQPGQTQEKLEALVAEMNEKFPSMKNFPWRGFKVYLSRNGDLPNYEEAGDVVITCSSLIHDSTNRHRDKTITLDGKKRVSQTALLCQHGLVEVPNDVARTVAGMYRVAQGFPAKREDLGLGNERDRGDAFQGKAARTKRGLYSGSAASYMDGVGGGRWYACASGENGLSGIVGGHPAKLKKKA